MTKEFEYVIATKKNKDFEFELARIQNVYPMEVISGIDIISSGVDNDVVKILKDMTEVKGKNYVYDESRKWGTLVLINIEDIGDLTYIRVKQYNTGKNYSTTVAADILRIFVECINDDIIIYGKVTYSRELEKYIGNTEKILSDNIQVIITDAEK